MIARASDDGHGTPKRYARQPDAALGGLVRYATSIKRLKLPLSKKRRAQPQVVTAAFSLSPRITNSVWGSFA